MHGLTIYGLDLSQTKFIQPDTIKVWDDAKADLPVGSLTLDCEMCLTACSSYLLNLFVEQVIMMNSFKKLGNQLHFN